MLYFNVVVKQEELGLFLKDPTYTKIEVAPKSMKNFRDFKLKCCLPVNVHDVYSVRGMMKAHSKNPYLPDEIKEEIGGFCGYLSNSLWLGIHDLKRLKEIEKKYNISFCIPKKYNIYLNN